LISIYNLALGLVGFGLGLGLGGSGLDCMIDRLYSLFSKPL